LATSLFCSFQVPRVSFLGCTPKLFRFSSAAVESPSGSKILELVMAAICAVCGKGPQFGNNVSHANNKTRRRWNVNLHPVKAKVEGTTNTKKMRVCSGCLKSGKVTKG
jgi:large subunit ribosomal protein L28